MRPNLDEQGQYKICSGDVAAVTQMQTDFTVEAPMLQMILCPVVFDTKRFLGSISDLPAKSTDSISKFRSRSSTFLHESCHVLGKQCECHRSFWSRQVSGLQTTRSIFRG